MEPVPVSHPVAKIVLLEFVKDALSQAEGDMTMQQWNSVVERLMFNLAANGYYLCHESSDLIG